MGGGASAMGGAAATQEMEELISCTYLLGRSLATLQYPDMYNLSDFHSKNALPLRKGYCEAPRILFGEIDESGNGIRICQLDTAEESDVDSQGSAPETSTFMENKSADEDHKDVLKMQVGMDTIVLDKPNEPNEDGWTPLMACSCSIMLGSQGVAIIDWVMQRGGNASDFEQKTKKGPGAYNSGWTALHMAAAYGVEPIVARLMEIKVECNTSNSVSWSPLNEATHRGFLSIIHHLVGGGANVNHIPNEQLCRNAPFLRAPAQSPLAEASRCGYSDIVKLFLDAGADKDRQNHLGWTPLHEASFFNQLEIVQLLLVYGADAVNIRNQMGLLPYHLACFPTVRNVIRELAGEAATINLPTSQQSSLSAEAEPEASKSSVRSAQLSVKREPEGRAVEQVIDQDEEREVFLHRGEMLGDLPALGRNRSQTGGELRQPPVRELLKERKRPKHRVHRDARPRAESKESDIPTEFLCEICLRIMKHPMRTPYGNVYERDVIEAWLSKNGSLDPLTGQPLILSQLEEDKELRQRINVHRSGRASPPRQEGNVIQAEELSTSPQATISSATFPREGMRIQTDLKDDNLYDF